VPGRTRAPAARQAIESAIGANGTGGAPGLARRRFVSLSPFRADVCETTSKLSRCSQTSWAGLLLEQPLERRERSL
jgi:hypothetical protein